MTKYQAVNVLSSLVSTAGSLCLVELNDFFFILFVVGKDDQCRGSNAVRQRL